MRGRPHVASLGTCVTGKVQFARRDAERIARWLRRDRRERVIAYRCRGGCRHWHVGHSNTRGDGSGRTIKGAA